MSKNRRKVALKSAKVSLSKGYFGQFKGYIPCSGNVGGFFASEGGSCHRGFTIVLTDFYTPAVLGGAVLLPFSAPAVYINLVP